MDNFETVAEGVTALAEAAPQASFYGADLSTGLANGVSTGLRKVADLAESHPVATTVVAGVAVAGVLYIGYNKFVNKEED